MLNDAKLRALARGHDNTSPKKLRIVMDLLRLSDQTGKSRSYSDSG